MIRSILAVVLLVLAIGPGSAPLLLAQDTPPATACVACQGQKRLACPTCSGAGKALRACASCGGRARFACRRKLDRPHPELDADVVAILWHKGTEVDCPNRYCRGGRVTWEGGKIDNCKLCGATGRVRCVDCQLSATQCAACSGKARTERVCLDCAGSGTIECVLCASTKAPCPGCSGKKKTHCAPCDGSGQLIQACPACQARGTVPCSQCAGLAKIVCGSCSGTTRIRSEVAGGGGSAGTTSCTACDAKGTRACVCKAGRDACESCGGAKFAMSDCIDCDGSGDAACRACGVWGHRTSELIAETLLKPEATPAQKTAAISMYQRALRQLGASETWFAAALKVAGEIKDRARLLEAVRKLVARQDQLSDAKKRCEKALARLAPAEKK